MADPPHFVLRVSIAARALDGDVRGFPQSITHDNRDLKRVHCPYPLSVATVNHPADGKFSRRASAILQTCFSRQCGHTLTGTSCSLATSNACRVMANPVWSSLPVLGQVMISERSCTSSPRGKTGSLRRPYVGQIEIDVLNEFHMKSRASPLQAIPAQR